MTRRRSPDQGPGPSLTVEVTPNPTEPDDSVRWRELIPARVRSELRWAGHEQLALDLDRLCDEDSP